MKMSGMEVVAKSGGEELAPPVTSRLSDSSSNSFLQPPRGQESGRRTP